MNTNPQNPIYGPNSGRKPESEPKRAAPVASPRNESTPNAYLKTRVLAASPAELRLMLIEGAIRFTEQARSGLEQSHPEHTFEGFSRARAVITELISGLDREVAPELCDRLNGLYTFLFTRLVSASSERSIEACDEVLELLRYEQETWTRLVEALGRENDSASSMSELPDAPIPGRPGSASGLELPAGGRISATG